MGTHRFHLAPAAVPASPRRWTSPPSPRDPRDPRHQRTTALRRQVAAAISWPAGSIILRIGIWWISTFPNSLCAIFLGSADILLLYDVLFLPTFSALFVELFVMCRLKNLPLDQSLCKFCPSLMYLSCTTEQNAKSSVWKAKLWWHVLIFKLFSPGKQTKI
jgi:hypothetical protein